MKVVSQGLFKAEGRRPSGLSWMASSCPRNLEAPRLSRSATLLAFRHEQLLLDSCGFVFFYVPWAPSEKQEQKIPEKNHLQLVGADLAEQDWLQRVHLVFIFPMHLAKASKEPKILEKNPPVPLVGTRHAEQDWLQVVHSVVIFPMRLAKASKEPKILEKNPPVPLVGTRHAEQD